MNQNTYAFGLVGLGVMGRNFILNVADNGFTAFGHDLDEDKVKSLLTKGGDTSKINASSNVVDLLHALSAPRKIMLLVPAGKVVDKVIEGLLPHLNKGDVIIDGGNSFFKDTDRRESYLKSKGIHFFGAGVSGGAKGARFGPSIMVGGSNEAYKVIQPIFKAVAAKFEGEPCVAHLGPKSAGNYVKMVHNGIEYGLMQLISEIYGILKKAGDFNNKELHEIFDTWNQGRLQSFLIEITAEIFKKEDDMGDGYLVDKILDKAKQKGTGKWTSQNAMDLGIPIPSIDIAVSMRLISALKEERQQASKAYPKTPIKMIDKYHLKHWAEEALYFGFILTYAQGFHQLKEASRIYKYNLELSTIAGIWRAGCIIRTVLLEDIRLVYLKNPKLSHLLFHPTMINTIEASTPAVRTLLAYAISNGIPAPAISNSLTYFDAFKSDRLPMNLIQAQRNYFGSHSYERTDREGLFRTDWTN